MTKNRKTAVMTSYVNAINKACELIINLVLIRFIYSPCISVLYIYKHIPHILKSPSILEYNDRKTQVWTVTSLLQKVQSYFAVSSTESSMHWNKWWKQQDSYSNASQSTYLSGPNEDVSRSEPISQNNHHIFITSQYETFHPVFNWNQSSI